MLFCTYKLLKGFICSLFFPIFALVVFLLAGLLIAKDLYIAHCSQLSFVALLFILLACFIWCGCRIKEIFTYSKNLQAAQESKGPNLNAALRSHLSSSAHSLDFFPQVNGALESLEVDAYETSMSNSSAYTDINDVSKQQLKVESQQGIESTQPWYLSQNILNDIPLPTIVSNGEGVVLQLNSFAGALFAEDITGSELPHLIDIETSVEHGGCVVSRASIKGKEIKYWVMQSLIYEDSCAPHRAAEAGLKAPEDIGRRGGDQPTSKPPLPQELIFKESAREACPAEEPKLLAAVIFFMPDGVDLETLASNQGDNSAPNIEGGTPCSGAKEAVSQRLQTIGQIASAVAHDFNNLLTAILGFTQFLKDRYPGDDASVVELQQIEHNSYRAKVMIRQLLTFSRGGDLKPVEFKVNSEISKMMASILRLMGENIKPKFKRGKNVGSIVMDTAQFYQIIINLVVNAKGAMKSGGELNIYTERLTFKDPQNSLFTIIPAGEYIKITVEDQGIGIPKKLFKKIFQTNFSTKGDKGNGLGLSTVANIVQKNGGYIDLESTLNVGSKFILYFPVVLHAEKTPAADPSALSKASFIKLKNQSKMVEVSEGHSETPEVSDLTGNASILLVEDEIAVRTICRRSLVSRGYTVLEAEDAEKGLELLQKSVNNIELIISDVMMPGISGLEFISRVRASNPKVKAILMSGYEEEIIEDNHFNLGDIHFLSKPFTPQVLAAKVKKVLS